MNKFLKSFIMATAVVVLLAACGDGGNETIQSDQDETSMAAIEEVSQIKEAYEVIDLEKIKPNEAGQVMVLMYHSISEPEKAFARTPENLRKDLQKFYDEGYRPISLEDYVNGYITTEAGYTPIVLTFDDAWQNNFNLIEDGNGGFTIDEDSAVAILEAFNKEHPDFPLEASFFVNDNTPFGQDEYLDYKINYIIDKGMDIGNHTATHINFNKDQPSTERIQKEIASIVDLIKEIRPDYKVKTMALPFGSRPANEENYKYLEKGEYEGSDYENIAILNVGWDPSKSPFHTKFNPLAIHRVRASDLQEYVKGVGFYDWMASFESGSRVAYVSDGNPNTVTVPQNYEEVIDLNKIKDRKLITY